MKDETQPAVKIKDPDAFIASGEKWLREMGIISNLTHNAFVVSLYVKIPSLKDLEYFIHEENKHLELHLKFGFFAYFIQPAKKRSLARELVNHYFPGYSHEVISERFK